MKWFWFCCPECKAEWASQQSEPDREWCYCNSAKFPVAINKERNIGGKSSERRTN